VAIFLAFLQLPQNTMTTTELSPGIYRIVVARLGVEPEVLTRHGKDGVTILPPSVQLDPEQEVIMSLSDELDCLSLTSSFSGQSPVVKSREASSSHAPPSSYQPLTLLTKALPRNPRKATGSSTVFLNSPRTNGTPQLLLDFVTCQSQCHLLAHCRVDPPLMQPSCRRFRTRY
jgi:hypothetical protein